jgi:hypothetical protein
VIWIKGGTGILTEFIDNIAFLSKRRARCNANRRKQAVLKSTASSDAFAGSLDEIVKTLIGVKVCYHLPISGI